MLAEPETPGSSTHKLSCLDDARTRTGRKFHRVAINAARFPNHLHLPSYVQTQPLGIKVTNVISDLSDGIVLANLLEILTGRARLHPALESH